MSLQPDTIVNLTIINELGLHARCAAQIAKIADQAAGEVWLIKNDERASAKSVLDMLTLACTQHSRVVLEISNPADKPLLQAIAGLIENGFGELSHV